METKNKVIQVRVTPSDYEKIAHYADKHRKKASTMARDMILDWIENREGAKNEQQTPEV